MSFKNIFFVFFIIISFLFFGINLLSAQSGRVTTSKGNVASSYMYAGETEFIEGTQSTATFWAFVLSGHQTVQCDYQGDPQQTPLELDENSFELVSNFGYSSTRANRLIARPGVSSPVCTGIPTLTESKFEVFFNVDGLDELSAGEYWIQINVDDAWGPISKSGGISWPGRSLGRVNFTVLPKQIDLSPSLSLSPNLLSACDSNPKTEISYTVENRKPDRADNVIIEIKDNKNTIYRSNIGSINGNSSKSGSITRTISGIGEHTIEIEVDPNDKIKETNEDNNFGSRTATLNSCPAVTVTVSANPSNVPYNGSTEVTWTVANATSCNASGGWSGSKNRMGGTQRFNNLESNQTYTLNCTGPGAPDSDSANVSVAGAPPAPTVSLSANPSSVPYNQSSTLTWVSSDATSCTASGDWSGNKPTSGNQNTGNLTANKNYTLTCIGPGSPPGSDSKIVTVIPPPSTGTISVRAKLDGNPWTGAVSYSINGPSSFNGTNVNQDFAGKPTGTWGFSYNSGGPDNSTFNGITISDSQTLSNGGTIIFTLNFESETDTPTPDKANLTLSNLNESISNPEPGERVSFSANLSNNGTAGTGSGFKTRFKVDGVSFSTKDESALASGSSRSTESSPWVATGIGRHQVEACTDIDNSISESNESDNCTTKIIAVSDPECPSGDCGECNPAIEDCGGGGCDPAIEDCGGGGCNPAIEDCGGGGCNPAIEDCGGGGGECNDGIDNDGDGQIDSSDQGCGGGGSGGGGGGECLNPLGCSIESPECNDGIDNDGDGWADLEDSGCGGSSDNDESDSSGGTQCSDGIDNDGDGFIDGNDSQCSSSTDNTEKSFRFIEF